MVHILFNLSEAVLVFAAVNILHSAGALDRIWAAPITSGGIANTHTLFNLACAVLLLPLWSFRMVRSFMEKHPIFSVHPPRFYSMP